MNMHLHDRKDDVLKGLFRQLPTAHLPEGFREHLMQRVRKEAGRMQQRKERTGLLTVIAGSVCMLLIGFVCIAIYGAGPEQVSGDSGSGLSGYAASLLKSAYFGFFVYIGILALLLLMADTWLRKMFFKRRSTRKEESVTYES